jgi:hypothetical protein
MKNVYEIFDDFNKANSPSTRIAVLQKGAEENAQFKNVLQGAYHPHIQFVIKEQLEYTRSDDPEGLSYGTMETEFGRIYLFTEGSTKVSPDLTLERKKQLAIQIMESLEAQEAEVFHNMLLKDLKVPHLDADIIEEAFPGLLH